MAGVDIMTVKELLGHKSLNMTLRYAHLAPAHKVKALEMLDLQLNNQAYCTMNTGMRKTEILTLTWDNVDLKHGFILLNITKNDERREIPINKTLRESLLGLNRRLDVPYLFFDVLSGKRYLDVKRSFNTACRRAKIKDFRFNDLRHTFASHLVMAGVDIMTVKDLLGHKSLNMTLRYAHLAPAHKVKALEMLDLQLNNQVYCTITAQSGV